MSNHLRSAMEDAVKWTHSRRECSQRQFLCLSDLCLSTCFTHNHQIDLLVELKQEGAGAYCPVSKRHLHLYWSDQRICHELSVSTCHASLYSADLCLSVILHAWRTLLWSAAGKPQKLMQDFIHDATELCSGCFVPHRDRYMYSKYRLSAFDSIILVKNIPWFTVHPSFTLSSVARGNEFTRIAIQWWAESEAKLTRIVNERLQWFTWRHWLCCWITLTTVYQHTI